MTVSRTNCGLLRDSHDNSPYQLIHIEVFHFVFWLAIKLLSQIQVDFLEMWTVSTRYVEVVRSLQVVLVVDFGIFCGKFPCTFWKTHILVRSCSSFRHRFGAVGRAENADIEQREKIIPFITFETCLLFVCLRVGFFGVNIFDLDFWVLVDSVK